MRFDAQNHAVPSKASLDKHKLCSLQDQFSLMDENYAVESKSDRCPRLPQFSSLWSVDCGQAGRCRLHTHWAFGQEPFTRLAAQLCDVRSDCGRGRPFLAAQTGLPRLHSCQQFALPVVQRCLTQTTGGLGPQVPCERSNCR